MAGLILHFWPMHIITQLTIGGTLKPGKSYCLQAKDPITLLSNVSGMEKKTAWRVIFEDERSIVNKECRKGKFNN